MTPITQQLAEYLRDKGVFGSWTSSNGAAQNPVKLQRDWLDEDKLSPTDRCLFLRVVDGGAGDRYTSRVIVSFSALSMVSDAPVFVSEFMEMVYSALLDFKEGDAIVAGDPLGRIGGPYRMESGRFVYDCEWSFIVESGRVAR